MAFATRCALYLVGGGVLFAWASPPRGWLEAVAVLAWIAVCAAADTLLAGAADARQRAPAAPHKRSRTRRWGAGSGGQEGRDSSKRPGLHVLFTGHNVAEAEALSAQLRERGLRPMLVTQRSGTGGEDIIVEVRLPQEEWRRAQPVMSKFSSR
jgi:hypothetical protein